VKAWHPSLAFGAQSGDDERPTIDIQLAESGDWRPRRRLLAKVSDDSTSRATASSPVCLGREAVKGASTSFRDAQPSISQEFAISVWVRRCSDIPRGVFFGLWWVY